MLEARVKAPDFYIAGPGWKFGVSVDFFPGKRSFFIFTVRTIRQGVRSRPADFQALRPSLPKRGRSPWYQQGQCGLP